MTPDEALAQGREYVESLRSPHQFTASADDLARAALDVAQFLMEYAAPADDEEAEPDPRIVLAESLPAGPARRVQSSASPGDYVYVRGGKSNGVPFVALETVVDGELTQLALSLVEVRAFAAGALDCADEAEGASPLLVFQPREGAPGE
ncbi:hypothetical protein OG792_32755 [Micromonospora sp. NBC_01699]|uniref:hypothetical protein n=1 Tax=Micromonospora sp. NBC_01699 TaxID=2975984 RepID=UPI002E2CAAD5|nr:hypothetical protein [Micromonospora sp. NBC_01699]